MESWAFWVSRGAMSEILFNMFNENLTLFQTKQLLVFDGTADPDRCWTMCYPNVDGRARCGFGRGSQTIYCVKVDMKYADLRALGRVRAEVGAVWDDVDTEQVSPIGPAKFGILITITHQGLSDDGSHVLVLRKCLVFPADVVKLSVR
ncbi:hypothetical protein FBUS_08795 [Fasciolopsis buskii]|uniref:Uncharacterized protein n=1 Tax=Fasciolopsis buskii TaxID=27845 RepID=A0A8E0VMK1_9TREM|nr:hypothetical protein FBUS_08795 [Fasciolopsis buski]